MLLDNTLQNLRPARVIPYRFRINHRDWSLGADSQTVHLAPVHQRLRACQVQLLEPPLEIFPRFQALLPWSAFGLSLVGAQQDMTPILLQTERLGCPFKFSG